MANQQLSSDSPKITRIGFDFKMSQFKLSGPWQLPVLLPALLVLLLPAQALARAARVQHQSEAQRLNF